MGFRRILMVECLLIMRKALGSNSSTTNIYRIIIAVYDRYDQTYWAPNLTDHYKD